MSVDRILGAIVLVASGALGFYAWRSYPSDAALFPVIVLVLMVIGGGVMVVVASLGLAEKGHQMRPDRSSKGWIGGLVILTLVACTAAIPWLGFYATCFVAMMVLPIVASGHLPTRRELMKDGLYAVTTVTVLYMVFEVWLDLQPPQGILV